MSERKLNNAFTLEKSFEDEISRENYASQNVIEIPNALEKTVGIFPRFNDKRTSSRNSPIKITEKGPQRHPLFDKIYNSKDTMLDLGYSLKTKKEETLQNAPLAKDRAALKEKSEDENFFEILQFLKLEDDQIRDIEKVRSRTRVNGVGGDEERPVATKRVMNKNVEKLREIIMRHDLESPIQKRTIVYDQIMVINGFKTNVCLEIEENISDYGSDYTLNQNGEDYIRPFKQPSTPTNIFRTSGGGGTQKQSPISTIQGYSSVSKAQQIICKNAVQHDKRKSYIKETSLKAGQVMKINIDKTQKEKGDLYHWIPEVENWGQLEPDIREFLRKAGKMVKSGENKQILNEVKSQETPADDEGPIPAHVGQKNINKVVTQEYSLYEKLLRDPRINKKELLKMFHPDYNFSEEHEKQDGVPHEKHKIPRHHKCCRKNKKQHKCAKIRRKKTDNDWGVPLSVAAREKMFKTPREIPDLSRIYIEQYIETTGRMKQKPEKQPEHPIFKNKIVLEGRFAKKKVSSPSAAYQDTINELHNSGIMAKRNYIFFNEKEKRRRLKKHFLSPITCLPLKKSAEMKFGIENPIAETLISDLQWKVEKSGRKEHACSVEKLE